MACPDMCAMVQISLSTAPGDLFLHGISRSPSCTVQYGGRACPDNGQAMEEGNDAQVCLD